MFKNLLSLTRITPDDTSIHGHKNVKTIFHISIIYF